MLSQNALNLTRALLSQRGLLVQARLKIITLSSDGVEAGEVLLSLHIAVLFGTFHHDQFHFLVISDILCLINLSLKVIYLLLEFVGIDKVCHGLRAEIFAHHGVLIKQVLVTLLNRVELFLELVDVLLLGHLHLLEDLFLSVQLTVEVLGLGDRLVHLVLELQVLLLQQLDLPIGRVYLDFGVFKRQGLIFELRSGC